MMQYQFESLGPTLRIVTVVFLILFALALLATAVVIAALPGKIARGKNHPQAAAINICGWFGLPTGILWVVAMVWAYTRTGQATGQAIASDDSPLLAQRLDKLELTLSRIESATRMSS